MELQKNITEFPPVTENCRVPVNSPKRPTFPRQPSPTDNKHTTQHAAAATKRPTFPGQFSPTDNKHTTQHTASHQTPNFPRTVLSDRQQTHDPARSSYQRPAFPGQFSPTDNKHSTQYKAASKHPAFPGQFSPADNKRSSCQMPSFPRTCWSYQHVEQGCQHSRPAILSKLYQGLHDVSLRSVSDRTHCVTSYLRSVFTYIYLR